jgi:hypothetical protein
VGGDRNQIFKVLDFGVFFNAQSVDRFDLMQPWPLISNARPNFSLDEDSLTKSGLFNERTGDKRIRFLSDVVLFGSSQKAIVFGMQFQDTFDRAFDNFCAGRNTADATGTFIRRTIPAAASTSTATASLVVGRIIVVCPPSPPTTPSTTGSIALILVAFS